ncbi:hypothetical protein A2630_04325 [Candidatus Woesebacteria bacterium RIFCSPHIGHO2_01_FULL_44_10]|uniref:Uncharacterized protein n=1 Tax=Candidatus Woesebacteria bacterium RIFCSPLOWO2_01_FULL_44_14 TaxID=1802525 RepID=A0A1F8C4S9_9BACT|nr:MAG: hypothetical protein A2630_04325 [Candidatus Woesebacteria bacterium RIFCSPHIGHO2_01_FULL_44_10]OGM56006.1 MAG: hypothetical protein A3F62_03745 [Candidatus Woesebacteria bacterium RIFCSPHIGHO2_12_FULL_44_11]OGM70728.1 MAG: hypothetical protein A2975_02455 [Candidatus Woesebacteria bacterium RIFCSPLOWO2_01_FULL_44_14]
MSKPADFKDLIFALKKAGFPTKGDVKQIVSDEFHEEITKFYAGRIKPEFDQVNKRLDRVDKRLVRVEVRLNGVEGEVRGLKEELSDTPSRGQFNDLKARVNHYHPAN